MTPAPLPLGPGAFFLYPAPRPAAVAIPWRTAEGEGCGSCRWHNEWGRERVPCPHCDMTCSEWMPRPQPTGHVLHVGQAVGGRNCVGQPFAGFVSEMVGEYDARIVDDIDNPRGSKLTPTALIEWAIVNGVKEKTVFRY